jgi:hypothetical protein
MLELLSLVVGVYAFIIDLILLVILSGMTIKDVKKAQWKTVFFDGLLLLACCVNQAAISAYTLGAYHAAK